MSAAGIRGLAIINVAEMLTDPVIATVGRKMGNAAATPTDLVSAITAMPAENAAMRAQETSNVNRRSNNVINVVAMQPMQTDPAVGMAARREEGVAMMRQEISNVSGRQGRGINADLTTSVTDGARIVAQIDVVTRIAMAGEISAELSVALTAVVTRIGMVAEISAARIVAQTADATPIGTVAVINGALTDASIVGIPIVRAAATSVERIGVIKVVVTPIVRAAGTNGDKTGDFIAPIVTVATGLVPAVDTAIGRQVTATLYTIEGMIRSDGCLLTGVGMFIPADLLAIVFRFPKLSVDAGVDLKKWLFSATTLGVLAISSRVVGASIAPSSVIHLTKVKRMKFQKWALSAPVFAW
ncbi:MAG: hypothetical protein AAF936_04970 [Pseudomonadota bacterium]